METAEYVIVGFVGLLVVFMIWIFSPAGRRAMKEENKNEREYTLQQIELERQWIAVDAEKERMRLELEAERARMEAELGVSLEKKPEVVYVEKPVYIERDSGGMSEGSKTAIKAGVAGAAGYAFGRKLL